MNAQELRIGNLVNHTAFGIVIIKGINELALKTKYKDNEYWDDLKFHKEIPLTEKWLLRFGFEKKSWLSEGVVIEVVYYQLSNFIIYLLPSKFEVELIRKVDKKQYNLFINFDKKVHILQNLYFALTGEELTIKELPRITR